MANKWRWKHQPQKAAWATDTATATTTATATATAIDGQGGGGVPLAAFVRVFVFVHSHQTAWLATRTYVHTWRWWIGNGRKSGTRECVCERNIFEKYACSTRVFHVSIARNVMRDVWYVRTYQVYRITSKIMYYDTAVHQSVPGSYVKETSVRQGAA